MSGIASEALTIPGSEATFTTCWSAWSSRIPCINRSSAKTSPGTLIFPRGGMRKRQSSIFRSEEHTSELQSRLHLVCRLLLEKKKKKRNPTDKLIITNQKETKHHSTRDI